MLFLRESAEQRAIANHIDDSRHAAAQAMHFVQGRSAEYLTLRRRRP